MAEFDLAIIGGGINGAGIARDAAGRGLRVILLEQDDLAAGTSSTSSKLIHGGLRYLEQGELRLVRESLAEREVLLRTAPHVVRPLRMVLPYEAGMRPAWMLQLGLFLYDRLGGRRLLAPSTTIDLTHHACGEPLKRRFSFAFEFSDCWTDDARLVVLTALDAAERGAVIRTRARCTFVERAQKHWWVVYSDHGARKEVAARVLINATGPWVAQVADNVLHIPSALPVRLVKGSHIVVRRLFDHDQAYIFQNPDKRVIFALPFAPDFTLIGTTEVDYTGDPRGAVASPAEIDYLCRSASFYFRRPVTVADVVSTFAGVRPLHGGKGRDARTMSRDYALTLNAPHGRSPLLTVYGGKLTTYRRLAQTVIKRLARFLDAGPEWTRTAALPGGNFGWDALDAEIARARGRWPFLTEAHARRLVHAYGTRLPDVLGQARSLDELGPRFGGDLTAAEVRYLMRKEWAQTPDDILFRRTKIGYLATDADRDALARFMKDVAAEPPRPA